MSWGSYPGDVKNMVSALHIAIKFDYSCVGHTYARYEMVKPKRALKISYGFGYTWFKKSLEWFKLE